MNMTASRLYHHLSNHQIPIPKVESLVLNPFTRLTDQRIDAEEKERKRLSAENIYRLVTLMEGRLDDEDRRQLSIFVYKRFTPEDRSELMAFMETKFSGSELEEIARLLDLVDGDGNWLQEKSAVKDFGLFLSGVMLFTALSAFRNIL